MQFLKILFWCLLAFAAAIFTSGNWTWIPIRLWNGLVAETNLPLLLLATFLLGLVPTFLYQHAVRWRLRQRLASAERTIAELRSANVGAARPIEPVDPALAPTGVLTAVPPGVA